MTEIEANEKRKATSRKVPFPVAKKTRQIAPPRFDRVSSRLPLSSPTFTSTLTFTSPRPSEQDTKLPLERSKKTQYKKQKETLHHLRRQGRKQTNKKKMSETTPRITAEYLQQFSHKTVRILGKVTQLRGETATIDSSGQIQLHLNRVRVTRVSSFEFICVGTWIGFAYSLAGLAGVVVCHIDDEDCCNVLEMFPTEMGKS